MGVTARDWRVRSKRVMATMMVGMMEGIVNCVGWMDGWMCLGVSFG